MSVSEKMAWLGFALGVCLLMGLMSAAGTQSSTYERKAALIEHKGSLAKACKEQGFDYRFDFAGQVECVKPAEGQTNE